jgi:microcystin-dependent protein
MNAPYIGETRLFAFGFAPSGWLPCEGQLLPITDNLTLFTLIGTTYGGDGETTFALPEAKGPQAGETSLSMCISLFGSFPQR